MTVLALHLLNVVKVIVHFAATEAIRILLSKQNVFVNLLQFLELFVGSTQYLLEFLHVIGQHHDIVVKQFSFTVLLV